MKISNSRFKDKQGDFISCNGNLAAIECRFEMHHRINDESVLEVSVQSEFLNQIYKLK